MLDQATRQHLPIKRAQPHHRWLAGAVVALLLAALGLGVWAVVETNRGDGIAADTQAVAELRAQERLEYETARWLASPQNVAALRAQDMAEYQTARWLASPQNVAAL